MIDFKLRPWGRPDWLIPKTGIEDWSVVSCLATEERSVMSAAYLGQFSKYMTLIQLRDHLSFPGSTKKQYINRNIAKFEVDYNSEYCFYEEHIKASLDRMEEIVHEISGKSKNILLDITSFPKRWFFPLLRFFVDIPNVENVLVAYTKGDGYPEIISGNPEPLRTIPSFVSLDERKLHDYAFIGVGFQTSGMRSMFGEDSARSLQLLFPFPPGPPSIQRNWKFAQQINRIVHEDVHVDVATHPVRHLRLEAVDTSQVFDALRITSQNGARTSVLAPYGPKPFSLAMCLFSLAAEQAGKPDVPVYYAQPQMYADEYTLKTSFYDNDKTDTWCYSVKHSGKNLYSL